MIDLHCHLLPGVDDGAFDVEDSVRMARQACADGIVAVCATPHIRHDHDVRAHTLEDRVRDLQDELDARGVGVRVLPGGEVAETALGGLDDDELRMVSLGAAGRWILLEPRPGPLSPMIVRAVDRLAARGYRSLIAHPERHAGDGWRDRLAEAVAAGALVQVTASLVSQPGVVDLAECGLLHVLGSDAHTAHAGRPVRLSDGMKVLGRVPRVADHMKWIAHTAPAAIVAGLDVEAPYAAG